MLNINIQIIAHNEHRCDTLGDWWWDGDCLQIRVSDMDNAVYEWLVAEHEINEALKCRADGVDEKVVTDFDEAFEELRKRYPGIIGDQEPGDMVAAPYNLQHVGATKIEQLSASFHGVDWDHYNQTVSSLDAKHKDIVLDSVTGKPRVLA